MKLVASIEFIRTVGYRTEKCDERKREIHSKPRSTEMSEITKTDGNKESMITYSFTFGWHVNFRRTVNHLYETLMLPET